MFRTRLAALVVFAAACVVFAPGGPTGVSGQEPKEPPKRVPFTWSTYTAVKDGKEYPYPKWRDDGKGGRELIDAQGALKFPETPAVTKVVFRVYQRGPNGGWASPAVINYEVTPAATYIGTPINGWVVVGKDNNVPKLSFQEGEELKIVWEVTTTTGGQTSVEIIELIITVKLNPT